MSFTVIVNFSHIKVTTNFQIYCLLIKNNIIKINIVFPLLILHIRKETIEKSVNCKNFCVCKFAVTCKVIFIAYTVFTEFSLINLVNNKCFYLSDKRLDYTLIER